MVIRAACGAADLRRLIPVLEAWFMHVPGEGRSSSTLTMLRGCLSSIRDDNPVIFVEHKFIYDLEGEVRDIYTVPLGRLTSKTGSGVTIIATMAMVHRALEAAEGCQGRHQRGGRRSSDAATLDGETIIESVRRPTRWSSSMRRSNCRSARKLRP